MTGWNLPPGCNVSDLPGNSPAEEAEEAMFDSLHDELVEAKLIEPLSISRKQGQDLIEFIITKMKNSYNDGWLEGAACQREYEEIIKTEEFAKKWREENI